MFELLVSNFDMILFTSSVFFAGIGIIIGRISDKPFLMWIGFFLGAFIFQGVIAIT